MAQTQAAFSDADRTLLRDSVREFLASRWPAEQVTIERSTITAHEPAAR